MILCSSWPSIARRHDATFRVVPANGGRNDPSHPGVEANVDIEYGSVMTYPTLQVFYSTDGVLQWSIVDGRPCPGDSYLEWLKYLPDFPNILPTITIS